MESDDGLESIIKLETEVFESDQNVENISLSPWPIVEVYDCLKPLVHLTRVETARARRTLGPCRGRLGRTLKYCDLCPMTSIWKQSVIDHIEAVHLKMRRFTCNICNYKGYSKSRLKKHSYIHQDLTQCKICYKWVAVMKTHMRRHSLVELPCKFCGKFYKKDQLPIHEKNVHLKVPRNRLRKTIKTWFCDLCPTTCKEKGILKKHMDLKHLKKKPFKCNICSRSTSTLHLLRYHLKTHEEFAECKICHKKVAHIENHMKDVHLVKKIPCHVCGKIMNETNLRVHIKGLHNNKIKCDQCDESLPNQKKLKWHRLKMHSNVRIFECHCGFVTERKHIFSTHQELHQNLTKSCPKCDKTFKTSTVLREHWKIHHRATCGALNPAKTSTVHKGPYICDYCGTVTPSRASFSRHLRCTHFAKMVTCDLCGKSCSKIHLIGHLKKFHRRIGKQICKICGFRTLSPYALKDHKISHGLMQKCPICNDFFDNIKKHVRYHSRTPRNKYKCPTCGMLVDDVRTHHLKAHGELKCPTCSKNFKFLKELKMHKLKEHSCGKFYACHCGSVFRYKHVLKGHQLRHNLTFSCELCDVKVKTLKAIERHWEEQHPTIEILTSKVQTLPDKSLYVCDFCGTDCTSRSMIYFHLQTHLKISF